MAEVSAIATTLDVMAPLTQNDMTLHDNLDADATYRRVADINGVPKDLMRPAAKVIEMRRARQEATEEQAQVERFAQGASAAQSAGQALAAFDGLQEAA